MEKSHGSIEIQPGKLIEYVEWTRRGQEDSSPVVCIHGVGGAMEMFREFTFPAFESAGLARFIAINLPGYGRSSRVQRHTLEAYRVALLQFLNAKGIVSCHLLGVSLGGSVVLSFAAQHEDRVLTVTAQGAVYHGKTQFPWFVRAAWQLLECIVRIVPGGFVERLSNEVRGQPWITGFLGRVLNPVDLKLLDQRGNYRGIAQESIRHSSLRAFFENLQEVGSTDLRDDIPRISVPTLITDGTKTVNGSVRSSAGIFQLLDAGVRHETYIPGSGHLAPYTNPEAYGEILLQFIRDHSRQ